MNAFRIARVLLTAFAVAMLPLAEQIGMASGSPVVTQAPVSPAHNCCFCHKSGGAVNSSSVFGVLGSNPALDLPTAELPPMFASAALDSRPGNAPFRPPRV